MIPVRAEDHGFVFQLGVAAFDLADHVACLDGAHLGGRASANPHGKFHGAEAASIGAFQQLVHSGADCRRDLFACLLRYPAGEGYGRLARSQLYFLIFASPRRSHHVPAIAGRGSGVDDDNRRGSVARGFFIFIGPAPVVGERRPSEEIGIGRRRLAGEQHDYFAAHIDSLIIVPLVLGRDDAVPDEHRRRIELRIGALLISDADEFVEPFERAT